MTDKITDAVSGEELTAFTAQMADGRSITVTARDEQTARALAREQGGVGVMSIGEPESPDADDDDSTFETVESDDDADETVRDPAFESPVESDDQSPTADTQPSPDLAPSTDPAAPENVTENAPAPSETENA